MRSAIYVGDVFHSRLVPKKHHFRYKVYMMYWVLGEEGLFTESSPLVSQNGWAPLQIKREDFHGNPSQPIKQEVIKTVKEKIDLDIQGPVAVLSNWRCFGFNFNPLSIYYCFNEKANQLQAIVAEVTNTPWLERHAYVLKVDSQDARCFSTQFEKSFTVSPFNPLDMRYIWSSTFPGEELKVSLKNYQESECVFSAALSLKKIELNEDTVNMHLRHMLMRFPWMTGKVVLAIYWQAFRLFMKGIPFLGKDRKSTAS